MNEEVLLRLGFDAAAVKRGTVAMMQHQKQSALEFVMSWKRAFAEVDREEAARNNRARALRRQREQERKSEHDRAIKEAKELADAQAEAATATSVRTATRSNRARALLRQRRQGRMTRFGAELLERRAGAGVALEDLARNVVGGGAGGRGHGGSGGMNSIAMRELVTIGREASRGNFSRIPSSLSILVQSLGKLGTVAAAVVNPITGLIAGLAAGATTIYKIGYNATQTIRQSRDVGFSTTGYQTFLRQAGRESGGREGAQSALETLSQNIGELRSGDLGQMRKFRKYGIATTTANGGSLSNEQIFQNVLAKYEATGDPAKRAAMAMDIFGESYKKFVKTLNEGQGGLNAASGKGMQSAGQLAAWSQIGSGIGDVAHGLWNGVKFAAGSTWNAAKSGYIGTVEKMYPWLGRLDQATQESGRISQRERDLLASGKIKPVHMSQKQVETLHPELLADFKSATMHSEDLQNQLEDRGKMGLGDLSQMGRRFTGHIRPRLYTVTARMRTAMKIDDLEASATNAWARGDDEQFKKLRGEADQMRKNNPWLTAMDRDPTRKVQEELIRANKTLEDMRTIMNQVTQENHD